jgi:hypothetical protein
MVCCHSTSDFPMADEAAKRLTNKAIDGGLGISLFVGHCGQWGASLPTAAIRRMVLKVSGQ